MSYISLLKIIMKPWLSTEDIQNISDCSYNGAVKIVKVIEEKVTKSGKMLPITKTKVVPTKMVLELLCLDEEYIYSMALKEQKIKNS